MEVINRPEPKLGFMKEESVDMIRDGITELINNQTKVSKDELFEMLEDSISDILDSQKKANDEIIDEVMGYVEGYIFEDEFIFFGILKHYLTDKFEEYKDHEQHELCEFFSDEFLKRLKNIDKHPEIKKIFIDMYNDADDEEERNEDD